MDDFEKLVPWVQGIAKSLSPGEMRSLSRRIGIAMRRANARRIAANVEPDGSPMRPRKPARQRRKRKSRELPEWLKDRIRANPALEKKFGWPERPPKKSKRKPKRMFRRLRLVSRMMIRADSDGVELYFRPKASATAEAHHFGKGGRPVRRLLGFHPDDESVIMDAVLAHLEKMGR